MLVKKKLFKKNSSVINYPKTCVRPLQFNYLSYDLFLEKKSCQTPKKKRKKSTLVFYGRKWFGNFLSDSKKKKKVLDLRIFIVSVIQSTPGIYKCCSRASYSGMYIYS